MINQLKNEKGLTIIEVVMSLAILMIIMVSVSGFVGVVLKNKDFAEQKQTAMLLGQEIMEELQLIDEIKKNGDGKYYIPLSGLNNLVKVETDVSTLDGTYKADIKNFNVSLELSKSLEGESVTPTKEAMPEGVTMEFEGDNTKIGLKEGDITHLLTISGTLLIHYDGNKVSVSTNDKGSLFVKELTGDKPIINLRLLEKFIPTDNFNVQIINDDPTKELIVNVYRHLKSEPKLVFSPIPSGWVKVIKNRFEDLQVIGDLYDCTLRINQGNKLLFEVYGNKTFVKQ